MEDHDKAARRATQEHQPTKVLRVRVCVLCQTRWPCPTYSAAQRVKDQG